MPRSLVSHFVSRERRLRSDFRSDKNVFVVTVYAEESRRGRDKNLADVGRGKKEAARDSLARDEPAESASGAYRKRPR